MFKIPKNIIDEKIKALSEALQKIGAAMYQKPSSAEAPEEQATESSDSKKNKKSDNGKPDGDVEEGEVVN